MKPTVSPIISLLSLFLALVPLRLPAQTPYTLSALDVDMVGDTIKFFHYSGPGEVPEWILIPENLGVRVIDRFGYSVLNPNIKRVSFPHTLRKISSHAFDTFSIEHIDLNPELEVIGEAAFCDNRISEVSIPDSLIYCGQRAFWANFVREINWPERRVKHFDYFAGFEADSVKYVEIPSYVTTIQDYAFYGNALDSVKFCEGLDSIRSRAFAQRGIIPTDVPLEVVIFAP